MNCELLIRTALLSFKMFELDVYDLLNHFSLTLDYYFAKLCIDLQKRVSSEEYNGRRKLRETYFNKL